MYHLYICMYLSTYLPISVSVSISISVSSLYCYDPQYSGSTSHSVHVAEEARFSVIHLTSGIPTSLLFKEEIK